MWQFIKKWLIDNWRLRVANLIAFLVIKVLPGSISYIIETGAMKYRWWQWLGARIPYLILQFTVGAETCAWLNRYLRISLRRKGIARSRLIANSLSLPIIQQSTYIPSALLGVFLVGGNPINILLLALFYFVEGMFWGAVLYGRTLDFCQRKIAGIKVNNDHYNSAKT